METIFLQMFAGKDVSDIQQRATLFATSNKVLSGLPLKTNNGMIYFCLEYEINFVD